MKTTVNEQPRQSTDGTRSPVPVSVPRKPDTGTRRGPASPVDPHQPIEEPGYGHGV